MDQSLERLIEEVRKCEHLYNSSSPYYKDPQMSQKTWNEISQNVGLDAYECVKKWKNVRDKYVRQRKRLAARNGDLGGKRVPAEYLILSWLAPHVKHRESESNHDAKKKKPSHSRSQDLNPNAESSREPSSSSSQPSQSSLDPSTEPLPSGLKSSICSKKPLASLVLSPLPRGGQKRRRVDLDESYLEQQMAALTERRLELQQKIAQETNDECSRFGQTMADLLRRFPVDERPDIMFRVFQMLNESLSLKQQ